jgi:alkaline phosphatase
MTCGADVRTGAWTVVKPTKRQAKNVILFIGDGLNIPIVTASRLVSRGMTGGFPNSKLNMERSERVGNMATSGIDSIMTDSANSAYAYASGHKSMMNALGVYADSNSNDMDDPKVELITERIRRDHPGMAIGLVTTSEIQDATPAAFWAHTRRRGNKAEITYQMLYGQDGYGPVVPDVIFGGGGRYFNGSDLNNNRISGLAGRNLWAEAEAAGYDVVFDRASMKARSTSGSKVLGIWHYANEDTWLDRHVYTSNLVAANHPVKYATAAEQTAYRRPVTDQPDLSEQVEAAIRILEARGGDEGFFLMVEGASIDKSEHPMDFDRAIGELIDMDNGIGFAMSYAAKHKDTLVLTTADHAQGYEVWGTVDTLAFNACNKPDGTDFAAGAEYSAAEDCKNKAIGTYQLAGFPDYVDANKDNFPDNWAPRFSLAQGKADHPYLYREAFAVRPKTRVPDMSGIAAAAAGSSSLSDDKLGIRLQGTNDPLQTGGDTAHTLADVPLWAHGPGSAGVRVYQQNVHLHTVMATALGLGYDSAVYPAGSSAAAAADATCGGVLPSIVRHATLGLLTTTCAPGAANCDASRPIVIGTTTYYRMTVSMDDLHVQVAADECAAM